MYSYKRFDRINNGTEQGSGSGGHNTAVIGIQCRKRMQMHCMCLMRAVHTNIAHADNIYDMTVK